LITRARRKRKEWGRRRLSTSGRSGARLVASAVFSTGHGVPMTMRDPPVTLLAAVDLRGPQGVRARLAVDGGRGVLQAGGIGHVADHVIREQLEFVRRALREALAEGGEKFVELLVAVRVAPRSQDAHGFVARPERAAGSRFA